jgi:hypothetical protein
MASREKAKARMYRAREPYGALRVLHGGMQGKTPSENGGPLSQRCLD